MNLLATPLRCNFVTFELSRWGVNVLTEEYPSYAGSGEEAHSPRKTMPPPSSRPAGWRPRPVTPALLVLPAHLLLFFLGVSVEVIQRYS